MPEDLVSVAQSLVPEILANLDRIDDERQLTPELAARMAKHRLFSLYAPRELGGPELDPLTAFRVVEAISRADGSAGWCVFNGTAITAAASRLTRQAARELFGDPPDLLGSGSARPEGTATLADGGYIINGRWNYLSGIDHSTTLFLNCRLLNPDGSPHLNDDGSRATRIAVVPVASGTVIDNWTTMGMRGTASNDCEYRNVFVPSHHTYSRSDVAQYDSPLYHPPQNAILLSWTLAAGNALGMARGALDAFHELAVNAGTTNSPDLLRDRAYVQVAYGECDGQSTTPPARSSSMRLGPCGMPRSTGSPTCQTGPFGPAWPSPTPYAVRWTSWTLCSTSPAPTPFIAPSASNASSATSTSAVNTFPAFPPTTSTPGRSSWGEHHRVPVHMTHEAPARNNPTDTARLPDCHRPAADGANYGHARFGQLARNQQ